MYKPVLALHCLREEKEKKHERKALLSQIEEDLKCVCALQQEKEMLSFQLQSLKEGGHISDIDPIEPRLGEAWQYLQDLKEKLSIHRIIGPCGLTVLEFGAQSIAVSFTCMWKNSTESFVLSIVSDGGMFRVKGTTIPYFICVQAMVEHSKPVQWNEVLDRVGRRLNAYVQRKVELDTVKNECDTKSCTFNDAVTSIELHFSMSGVEDSADEKNENFGLTVDYESVDAVLPSRVEILTGTVKFSPSEMSDLGDYVMRLPLSEAIPQLTAAAVRTVQA